MDTGKQKLCTKIIGRNAPSLPFFISGSTFAVIFGRVTSLKEDRDKIWLRNDSVIDVACGDSHVALVTESGKLYTFGANEWGQLGLGHTKALGKPSQVKGEAGKRNECISNIYWHEKCFTMHISRTQTVLFIKVLICSSSSKGIEQEKVTQAACGQTHTVIATGESIVLARAYIHASSFECIIMFMYF